MLWLNQKQEEQKMKNSMDIEIVETFNFQKLLKKVDGYGYVENLLRSVADAGLGDVFMEYMSELFVAPKLEHITDWLTECDGLLTTLSDEAHTRAKDENGWFHVNKDGKPAYTKRYLEVGNFCNGYAAVRDNDGWFHVNYDGKPAYPERYSNVGLFDSYGLAPTRNYIDGEKKYMLLNRNGDQVLTDYANVYNGDYDDSFAIVEEHSGKMNLIRKDTLTEVLSESVDEIEEWDDLVYLRDGDTYGRIDPDDLPKHQISIADCWISEDDLPDGSGLFGDLIDTQGFW